MCITKWKTASLKTMNNVLDFNNLFISKGPYCQNWYVLLCSFLKIEYFIHFIYLYIFPIRESYTAAYMKQENCVLLSRVNKILWNKIMKVCYSLKTEVFQGKFHNAFCSLRDLLKLSLWNCLGVCFLLDHGLVLVLANLTMISSMILRGLMQWHFWETVSLIFSCIFFPYSFA